MAAASEDSAPHAPRMSRMSRRIQRETSGGAETWARLREMAGREGVINLGQGFPDFSAVPAAVEAAKEVLGHNQHNQYAAMGGSAALCDAISAYYGPRASRQTQDGSGGGGESMSPLDPAHEMCVTTGGTEALHAAMLGMVDPGDVVLVFAPLFPWYLPAVRLAGGVPKCVTLQAPHFSLLHQDTRAEIEEIFRSHGPKVVIFNTPHNPTGHCASMEELSFLADLAQQYDTVVVSDEVYEACVFPGSGEVHRSISTQV